MKEELIIDYTIALTNLYGVVTKQKLIEIYNLQNEDQVTLEDLKNIVTEETLEKHHICSQNYSYIDDYLDDENFNLTLLLKQQKSKPYYIPQKEELLKYTDEFYTNKPKEYGRLERYIKKELEIDRELVEGLCEDLRFDCEMNDVDPKSILYNFESYDIEFKDEKQITEVLNLVMDLYNNTRLKENRGHTAEELFNLSTKDEPKQKKVGRNDLCPCGSGKKYKKCCIDK